MRKLHAATTKEPFLFFCNQNFKPVSKNTSELYDIPERQAVSNKMIVFEVFAGRT